MGKIIAIYGNTYKTTTAINLTELLSRIYGNSKVAYVSLDDVQPALPLVIPTVDDENSLGKLFASIEDFDDRMIYAAGECVKNNLAVYGYNKGENVNSYAVPPDEKIDTFYMYMRTIFDFTVIDCTKDIMRNKYTAKAVINSDVTVNLISSDIYGLMFFDSQKPIWEHVQYNYSKFINCLTLGGAFEQDTMEMKDLTNARHIIPYSKKASEAINRGLAFRKLPDRNYRRALQSIIEEITGVQANADAVYNSDDENEGR